MIKWFAYIVLLLMLAPGLSFAKNRNTLHVFSKRALLLPNYSDALTDTTKNAKHPDPDDKKKIKEIAKARRQPKPEKIVTDPPPAKVKPKRQRRPEGLERPPEIPRRNGGD